MRTKLIVIATVLVCSAYLIARENSAKRSRPPANNSSHADRTVADEVAIGAGDDREIAEADANQGNRNRQVADVYPLTVNGRQWTFRTRPPEGIKVRAGHPRLLVTPDNREEVAAKLNSRQYARGLRFYQKTPVYKALRYVCLGEHQNGIVAKDWLLKQEAAIPRFGDQAFFSILVYDWCYDLFTSDERERAMAVLMGQHGMKMPEAGIADEWEVTYALHKTKDEARGSWFGNNLHEPRGHDRAYLTRGVMALAFHGDGVRDEWCEYVFQRMLDGQDGRIYPIYDPENGALLDLHNLMALNSGGTQAGHHNEAILSGYNGMFYYRTPFLLAAWQSATGDNAVLHDNNAMRRMAHWVAYELSAGEKIGPTEPLVLATGAYKDFDPDSASLAQWLLNKYTDGTLRDVFSLIVSDRSVPAKSPAELGMPTAHFLDGGDLCISRSSWDDDATEVRLDCRPIDTNRYEKFPGLMSITSRGEKLIIRGRAKKGSTEPQFGSGIWIYPEGKAGLVPVGGSTMWGAVHLKGTDERVPRATYPFEAASRSGYRASSPTENQGEADHHVFGVDSARIWVSGKKPIDVQKCKRTLVHLKPAGGREIVVVYDRVVTGPGLVNCWGCRVMNQPAVSGNRFAAVNDEVAIHATLLTPGRIEVRGGPGKATEGPEGERYDRRGYLFRDDDSGRDVFGSYSVFIKPQSGSTANDYCVVFEIGDAGFTPVEATLTGKVVSVDGWSVDFSVEDRTKVTR